MMKKIFKTQLDGQEISFEIGRMAQQANGSCLVQSGQTAVLATVTMSQEKKDVNFLPLSVSFEEKFYAIGRIRRNRFVKREGRPSDEAILHARVIDRSIRPYFDPRIRNEIQVVVTVLSSNEGNGADILGLLATSVALSISDIPWQGPIAGIRFSWGGQEWKLNSIEEGEQLRDKKLEMILTAAGVENKISMIEMEGAEVEKDKIIEGLKLAQEKINSLINFQQEIVNELKPIKAELELVEINQDLKSVLNNWLDEKLPAVVFEKDKKIKQKKDQQLKKEIENYLQEKEIEDNFDQIEAIIEEKVEQLIRRSILEKDQRPDGRGLKDVRVISVEVGVLPYNHGSALFSRGETQVLSVVTLGAPGDEQTLDNIENLDGTKRYFHHYNFPPYCVGEVGRIGFPSRREIGHGSLAEKALRNLIPAKENFPYTIRVVSEVLSSNGSSSMASVCGSTLSLMDTGVPILRPAAGVAIGLINGKEGEYKILTDIQGPEDHYGDMDLKVAGTKKGFTALQMDVKIEGVDINLIREALEQGQEGYLAILAKMEEVISQPRSDLSPYAPRIYTLQINPDKIRNVIGPGGKVINEIIKETAVQIDIEDSGLVMITSKDRESAEKALEWVKNLTREVKIGEIFQGKVSRILNFGLMVDLLPGQSGLLHISQLGNNFSGEDLVKVFKVGEILSVKIKEIDSLGRVNLSLADKKVFEKVSLFLETKTKSNFQNNGRHNNRRFKKRSF